MSAHLTRSDHRTHTPLLPAAAGLALVLLAGCEVPQPPPTTKAAPPEPQYVDPQSEAGQRLAAPVNLMDVMPTLLDTLGLPPVKGLQGRSLQPLLRESVTSGAARSANLAGNKVSGVVAQVPYGSGKTVSWFVGFRGNVAFALAVEGKVNAAAVAARFLRNVPG